MIPLGNSLSKVISLIFRFFVEPIICVFYVKKWRQDDVYFRSTKSTSGRVLEKRIIWCSREPLKGRTPMHENIEQDVWYTFANYDRDAAEELLKDMENG